MPVDLYVGNSNINQFIYYALKYKVKNPINISTRWEVVKRFRDSQFYIILNDFEEFNRFFFAIRRLNSCDTKYFSTCMTKLRWLW